MNDQAGYMLLGSIAFLLLASYMAASVAELADTDDDNDGILDIDDDDSDATADQDGPLPVVDYNNLQIVKKCFMCDDNTDVTITLDESHIIGGYYDDLGSMPDDDYCWFHGDDGHCYNENGNCLDCNGN